MNTMKYLPRLSQSYPTVSVNDRKFKVYGVFSDPSKVACFPSQEELVSRIGEMTGAPTDPADHGLGFAIVHLALDGDYLLLSQWVDANMLQHRVYKCVVDNRKLTNVESLAETGIIACVWELEIMKFERDSWVRTMLNASPDAVRQPTGDPEAYLQSTYTGWV
ncbi:hypothetical protein [Pseudomonas brassicacearum]|uniref:Uncharacterized protein n=1 Tax=Pseudomonas brassicacearum TaxID=930166 RepID=A0A423GJF4_9PSED|nr:hypothetical protein [Pseudomonas brassicacearum]ROM90335.1 hypothetical protein BK658_26770 [Pseudomonas brassicacearum]